MDISGLISPILVVVGRQVSWKDHLDFCCHSLWMDVWMQVALQPKRQTLGRM